VGSDRVGIPRAFYLGIILEENYTTGCLFVDVPWFGNLHRTINSRFWIARGRNYRDGCVAGGSAIGQLSQQVLGL
jgi:hypothetical protein